MPAGVNNTELCPTRFFTGEPLYLQGMAPDAAEVAARREQFWQQPRDRRRAAEDVHDVHRPLRPDRLRERQHDLDRSTRASGLDLPARGFVAEPHPGSGRERVEAKTAVLADARRARREPGVRAPAREAVFRRGLHALRAVEAQQHALGTGAVGERRATEEAARTLELELKLIADIGLVGQPNAGKSTLLNRIVGDLLDFVRGLARLRREHPPQGKHNALQKAAYNFIFLLGVLSVLSGFAIYIPIQLSWLTALFGGF